MSSKPLNLQEKLIIIEIELRRNSNNCKRKQRNRRKNLKENVRNSTTTYNMIDVSNNS